MVVIAVVVFAETLSNVTRINSGAVIAVAAVSALLFSILVTELKEWKNQRWQFSVRSLLLVMTLLGVGLGAVVYALRQ
jgi:hypothetical protein